MENYIRYFYNINPQVTHRIGANYFFKDGFDNSYCLYDVSSVLHDLNEIQKVYDLSKYLIARGIYCHQILLNKEMKLNIAVDNKLYVLLKYSNEYGIDKKIEFNDIVKFSNIQMPLFSREKIDNAWKSMWSVKIDYFEYQLNQFGYKHPLLRESFGYYSGLVELAISLINSFDHKMNLSKMRLCHKRLRYQDTFFEFYNPFNIIIDYIVRDFCEYCKSVLYISCDHNSELINKILKDTFNHFKLSGFDSSDIYMFFVRFLYATEYFDLYEWIMENNLKDDGMGQIIEKTPILEDLIKKIYNYIKINFPSLEMLKIEWLDE